MLGGSPSHRNNHPNSSTHRDLGIPLSIRGFITSCLKLFTPYANKYLSIANTATHQPPWMLKVEKLPAHALLMQGIDQNNVWLIQRAVAQGAYLEAVAGEDGMTLLNLAVMNGDAAQVATLIQSGANKETTDIRGMTPLINAIGMKYSAIVTLLIKAGADIASETPAGFTPFYWAVFTGNTDAVRALISAGVPRIFRDSHGHTALGMASYRGHLETVEYLLTLPEFQQLSDLASELAANDNALLMAAIKAQHDAMIQWLLQFYNIRSIELNRHPILHSSIFRQAKQIEWEAKFHQGGLLIDLLRKHHIEGYLNVGSTANVIGDKVTGYMTPYFNHQKNVDDEIDYQSAFKAGLIYRELQLKSKRTNC